MLKEGGIHMKRDPVLLARILEAIEAAPYDFSDIPIDLHLEGYSEDAVAYHVLLLNEAGLITTSSHGVSEDGRTRPRPIRLTWEGHEYLERSTN
jgi:DNA-binding transcriptional ArsR family regulator